MIIKRRKQPGFTIVELLIVIVVIGILAAITIVAYNGIQQRARDTARKSDLAQIAKGLQIYNIDKGDFATVGCGASGGGFYDIDYDGAGPLLSISQCLISAGSLSIALSVPLPATCVVTAPNQSCTRYMKYDF